MEELGEVVHLLGRRLQLLAHLDLPPWRASLRGCGPHHCRGPRRAGAPGLAESLLWRAGKQRVNNRHNPLRLLLVSTRCKGQ